MSTTATPDRAVGRKPKDPSKKAAATDQIAFRAPDGLKERIEAVANRLGLDASNFLRMMALECLPIFEERANKIHGRADE